MIREGFDIEIKFAHEAAHEGRMYAMTHHLSAANALALWADTSLLADYGRHDAECWQEYEQWKTTNRAAT